MCASPMIDVVGVKTGTQLISRDMISSASLLRLTQLSRLAGDTQLVDDVVNRILRKYGCVYT